MKIVEIKSRGYNAEKDKWELCALVKSSTAFSGYEYKRFLYLTAEELYNVKVGDIVQ